MCWARTRVFALMYASVTSDGRDHGEWPKAKELGRSAWASGVYCSPVVPLYVPWRRTPST